MRVHRTVYFQEEPERVLEGYRAVIAASPSDHVRAVHSLATLEGDAVSAAPQYVREVFDELAETFEEKLVTHLEYRVPWQLVDALKRLEPAAFAASATPTWVVADVGCGTGLCGRLLRPHVKRMIGVRVCVVAHCERLLRMLNIACGFPGGHFAADDRQDACLRVLRRPP
jgi:predicted TPR repeat methyltransferase